MWVSPQFKRRFSWMMFAVAAFIVIVSLWAIQIFVRHFVSDTNDDDSNIQGKFGEAAEKAVDFFTQHNLSNEAIRELTELYQQQRYPVIKKISIKNHIELMYQILRGS